MKIASALARRHVVAPLAAVVLMACGSNEPSSTTPEATASSEPSAAASTSAASTSADAPTAAPTASAAAPAASAPPKDAIGGIEPGSSDADVTKAFGKPSKTTKATEEAATGDFSTEWSYPAKGLSVILAGAKATGPFSVRLLSIEAPSTLHTARGMGIGSTFDEVTKSYGATIGKSASGPTLIVIGEELSGLRFNVDAKTKKVTSIEMGQDGE